MAADKRQQQRVHGTVVVPFPASGQGILLLGPSGAGKSDLALRMVEAGGGLVADDQVMLTCEGNTLVAAPVEPLAGMLEVRGIGIVALPTLLACRITIACSLVDSAQVERMPEPAHAEYCGVRIPLWRLAAFEASTVAKLRLALKLSSGDISLAT
ncbi:MAG: HPr kinase/phosphatase C-terminal domain-containing protein [Pseudomonadota bacterium]